MTKEFVAFTRLDASDVNAYLVNRPLQNAIINGAFEINQRNFSSTTASNEFTFDRWRTAVLGDGTTTFSSQAFTPGLAPEQGYEATRFQRIVTTGQTTSGVGSFIEQRIENVRTFANETVTFSFWAKAASGTPKIALEFQQFFGVGGSPSATVNTYGGQVTISTSWARYSVTVAIPSVSGKTIGTTDPGFLSARFWVSAGSDFNARTGSLGIQSNTFDIWGVQLEAGTVANPFRRNANSIQGELAACQRYYYRIGGETLFQRFGNGYGTGTTTADLIIPYPVPLRVKPTVSATVTNLQILPVGVTVTSISTDTNIINSQAGAITANAASGLTSNVPYSFRASNSLTPFIEFNSEM
jgi:hypothetical protein